ncbi:hypothetical protein Bca52824_010488 [Brassica carinata]|uniref:Disease resistance R13L4/SHOC-2-like LRR domain-containing protein n=1 Tax=Brassica carinata TaxID=52824 RepID=A0A8X8BA78_BRACI|nr:hypothetical protein Bca52824_010488 [Brassica carinata]
MSVFRMCLHFLSLILLYSHSSFVTTALYLSSPVYGLVACPPHQIQALNDFKNEFDTLHCDHSDPFNGVWCDNSTGAVTMLRLRACLSGTLKPNSSLFTLHHLRYLKLSQNNFTSSSLPSEFVNLNRLEVLSLSYNGFVGQVPSSFNNLSMLSVLSLSRNELTGSFPLLQNLTRLSILSLADNHFSGTLNPNNSLFELQNLRYLDLAANNFSSSLPSEFGNLYKLEVLCLSTNDFFGHVPPTFSNLTSLTELYFAQNKFTGSFPYVQNLTRLSYLGIFENHFSGTIPYVLTMPFLSYLDVRGNNFSGSIGFPNSSLPSRLERMLLGNNFFEGQILEPILKLTNLKLLDLSFLSISYPIDVSIFSSFKSLWYLDLSGNSISPASLGSNSDIPLNLKTLYLSDCGIKKFPNILKILQKLEIIDLINNRIKGKVPEWLWSLPRLSSVVVANNSFSGFEGHAEILVNSSVKILDLQLNLFEGAIPILPLSINVLAAGRNSFTGSLPLSICKCKSLTHLILPYNNLTGTIPHCLSNWMFVNLRKNNLEGSIPDKFHARSSLQTLNFGYNRLAGKLPRSLANCSSLQFLSVDNNKIEDMFPFWLKTLPNLQVFILRSNKFYGSMSPHDQGPLGFPALRILEISDNKFTGKLPPSFFENWKASSSTMNEDGDLYMAYRQISLGTGYKYMDAIDLRYKGLSMEQANVLTTYATIDFSGNRFEGQIPESIGLLKALIALNLSNNAFTGHIPLSLANLGKLESLDLSINKLSGTIPNGLSSLSFLAYLNVSYNQLKGEIPQGTQIIGQPESSFEGNAGLCDLPLRKSCFVSNEPPTQQPTDEDQKDEEVLNWKGVVMGYGPGVLLGLALGQVIASYKPEWLVKIIGLNKRRNR